MAHKIARFGWLPDLPDQRDFIYAALRPLLKKLPAKIDLRKQCPQGQLRETVDKIAANLSNIQVNKDSLTTTDTIKDAGGKVLVSQKSSLDTIVNKTAKGKDTKASIESFHTIRLMYEMQTLNKSPTSPVSHPSPPRLREALWRSKVEKGWG